MDRSANSPAPDNGQWVQNVLGGLLLSDCVHNTASTIQDSSPLAPYAALMPRGDMLNQIHLSAACAAFNRN